MSEMCLGTGVNPGSEWACTACLGTGVFSLVPEQGHHFRPLLLLQNGYINFDKRRKVSRLRLDAGLLRPCPRKGKGEANSGVPEFWLLQFEGSFPGVCYPFRAATPPERMSWL